MAINNFNAKNGLSVGSNPINVVDNTANATFATAMTTGSMGVGTPVVATARLFISGTSTSSDATLAIRAGVPTPSGRLLDIRNNSGTSVASVDYLGNIFGVSGSFSGDVSITGNLTVAGTQTIINSDIVNIKDNIVLLNAGPSPASTGGIYVADTVANTTGSLVWDSVTDQWKAGRPGTETALVSGSGTNNYVTKWVGSNAVGAGVVFDDGTNVGIGTTLMDSKFVVAGNVVVSGSINPSADNNANYFLGTASKRWANVVATSFSGSLTKLSDGTTSYLQAGSNIAITTGSNGSVTIATTGLASTTAQYLTLAADASLSSERVFTPSTGLKFTDGGAGGNYTLSINDSVVATVSGTTFTGVTNHSAGLSGSLTRLTDGTSYLIAGTGITIATGSNGSVTITGNVGDITSVSAGNGLLGGGTSGDVSLSINNSVVATISGSTFTGAVKFNSGLSGSLTQLVDGTSYLVAGSNIQISTGSNGSVNISSPNAATNSSAYITVGNDSTLTNERALTAGTGLKSVDGGANGAFTLSINDSVVATVSGTTFTGATRHNAGLSGSLTKLTDGTSYLVAGSNVQIVTGSNGSVTITSTATGASYVAGSTTQVQFNDGGTFGADADFTFDKNNNLLKVTNISGSLTGSNVLAGQVVIAGAGGVLSGTNEFVWDNALSRVGVGTSAPANKFHILGSSNDTVNRANSNLTVEGGGGNGLVIGTYSSAAFPTYVQSGYVSNFVTATYALSLNPLGGNVGIGITNPSQLLHVAGDVNVSSGQGFRINNTATSGQYLRGDGTRFVSSAIQAADVPTLNQSTTGNAATATALQNARTLWGQSFDGTANVTGNLTSVGNITGTAGVNLTATSATLALTATGANAITATTNGSERLRVDAAGNVGIGTADANGNRLAISGGNLSVTGSVLPGVTTAYDIGSTTYRWRDLYARTGSFSGDVTITGDLTVNGTQFIVNTQVVEIEDNAILLNAGPSPAATGGIYVADTTTGVTGSLLWDAATDQWKSGKLGSEITLVSGSGNNNYVAKWNGSNALGTSIIYDDGTNVGVGTGSPANKFHVFGSSNDTVSRANSNLTVEGGGGNGLVVGTYSSARFPSYIQSGYVPNFGTATYVLALNPLGGNVGIGTTETTDMLAVNGSLSVTGSLLPGANNSYTLGNSSKRWSNVIATAFSGSLTKLSDGVTNYLQAGPNITLTTGSNGSITIEASMAGGTVSGTGTVNYVAKFTGANSIGNGIIYDNGTNVGIGTTVTTDKLAVNGSMSVTGSLLPGVDNQYDLGSSTKRWRSIQTTSISGSLTRLTDGTSFIIAGGNMSVVSGSNGAITLATVNSGTIHGVTAGNGLLGGGTSGTVTLSINNSIVATVSGTTFTGDISAPNASFTHLTGTYVLATSGISGSLTKLSDGTSYLIGGSSISIVTGSSGAVTISAVDVAPLASSYLTVGNDATLPNERSLTAGNGLKSLDGGAGSSYTLSINDSVVATVSGTTFTGPVKFNSGLSGSLTKLTDGTSYLVAGNNIGITSASNGSVTISTNATANPDFFFSTTAGSIYTTGSVAFVGNQVGIDSPFDVGASVNFYVSGTRTSTGADNSSILLSGDTFISGAFGVSDYIQMKPVGNLRIPTNTSASYIYTSGSTNDLYYTQYQPGTGFTNTVRMRWFEGSLSTGLLHGGVISTANGSTTFSVTAGSGLVVDYNASTTTDPYPTVHFVSWPAYVSASLTYSGSAQITYVGINSSGGLIQQFTPFANDEFAANISLGRVLHQSGSITNGTITSPTVAYGLNQSNEQFNRSFGPLKVSGHLLQNSGSNLSLSKTSGTSYVAGRNYTSNPDSPNLILPSTDVAPTVSKIFREYVSGSTPVIDSGIANAGYPTIDPTQYNNNGTLSPVSSGLYSIQRVYWFPNSVNKAFFVYYGSAAYNSLDLAQAAINTEEFAEGANTIDAAIYLGAVIVRGNASDLSNTSQARFVRAGLFRGVDSTGGGGGGSIATVPGGLDTYVQFNDGGSTFGGDAGLTFDKINHVLNVGDGVVSGKITTAGATFDLINTTATTVNFAGAATSINIGTALGTNIISGTIRAPQGLSGSLTRLTDGSSYLIAGTNMQITTGSTGAVTIANAATGATYVAGSSTQVQFNDGGTFGADGDFTFDKTNNLLQVTNISGSLTGSNVLAGHVVVAGTGGLLSGSNNFWWDNAGARVGIGTSSFTARLHVSGSSTSSNSTMTLRAGVSLPTGGILDVQGYTGSTIFEILETAVETTIPFRGPNGTATAPTFSFTGGQTTGMYRRTSGQLLNFTVSGVQAFGIDTNGNAAIGVTATSQSSGRLHVQGGSSAGDATTPTLLVRHGVANGANLPVLDVQNSASTSLMFVSGSGNVGIGTVTPGARLHAYGSAANGSVAIVERSTGDATIAMGGNTSNTAAIHATAGTTLALGVGATYSSSNNFVNINSAGNVGIGTAAFTDKLAVNGSMSVTGSLLPGVDNTYDLGSSTKRWSNVYANNVVSSGSLGPAYTSPSSTSGTTALFDTVSISTDAAVYELMIIGNPNSSASTAYRDVIYGKVIIGTGNNGAAVRNYIQFIAESPAPRSLYGAAGNGPLTADVVYLQSGSEFTDIAQGGTATLRVKIAGYAAGFVGNNTTVRLKQLA